MSDSFSPEIYYLMQHTVITANILCTYYMLGSLLKIFYGLFSQWTYEIGTIIGNMLNLPKVMELIGYRPGPRRETIWLQSLQPNLLFYLHGPCTQQAGIKLRCWCGRAMSRPGTWYQWKTASTQLQQIANYSNFSRAIRYLIYYINSFYFYMLEMHQGYQKHCAS